MILNGIKSTLVFYVNGIKIEDSDIDPEWTLLYYLRKKLRLTGTKLGCGEGGCGACTVMVSKFDRNKKKAVHLSVNACLMPVTAMHGLAVTTVEGIGSVSTKLHPVQERIAKAHGSQCGFCTPGIVMSMYTLLRNLPKPTMDDIETAFQGNLCRCTGYRPILEGYKTFTDWEQKRIANGVNGLCAMGDECCKSKKLTMGCLMPPETNDEKLFKQEKFTPYDPTQEIIFPPELAASDVYDNEYLIIKGPRVTWYRPIELQEFLRLKHSFPDAKIINGNTEIGVEVKFKNCFYPVLLSSSGIKELAQTQIMKENEVKLLKVGAGTTLTELETLLVSLVKTQPASETKIFEEILNMLHLFAGKQIRNVGTVGGNIMTGSPISDLNPIFMASGCKLILVKNGQVSRTVKMDNNFWKGYRKNIVQTDEVLMSILIPFTKQGQFFKAYKQSKRRDDDIAIVNAAFFLDMENLKIKSFGMAFGGMAPVTTIPAKTCTSLIALDWNKKILDKVCQSLIEELPLDPSAPGGMINYRRTLTLSLFFKFYLTVDEKVQYLPNTYLSGTKQFHTVIPSSSQYFSVTPSTQKKIDPVGRPIIHQSAFKQTTGEAMYCDDIPTLANEAYLVLVTSTKTYAKILSIDATKALNLPGVVKFFSAKDIDRERNICGVLDKDEEVFASDKVYCIGQVIGAVVATDLATAQRAKNLINVQYEDLSPKIITIEDAIREKSFHKISAPVIKGNFEEEFKKSTNFIEGEIRVSGQEHFYLETQNTIAIPHEDNEIEIISSTQDPTELQKEVADILGLPRSRITCKVKRMGGGFGGKQSRSCILALPVAFAAHKLKRPVRMCLDRDEDMLISGTRNPYLGKYKVSYTDDGRITACLVNLYSNAGWSLDLSEEVMTRAKTHFVNACDIPNILCNSYVCKTNLPSNTAFRGFGAPQGMLVGEVIVAHLAETLKMDPVKVHEINFVKSGMSTCYGQTINDCMVEKCWNECLDNSKYEKRKIEIEKFNRENRFRKRGLAVIPTMYAPGYDAKFMNQAGALILIYSDGSVLLTHGGTEMGQGLHTKMIQVASRALGISPDKIHLSETSTDKVPNTTATAASVSSDLNGMAVLNACEIINERLKNIKEKNRNGSWEDWIKTAYFSRISLSAAGFYKTPDINWDPVTMKGNLFNYFVFGAACSEVEIDCLTGDHQVIRTDIVMDIGESLNPAIDVGQIEGAFMQGYGLYTMEEPIISSDGCVYTRGPGTYKIPGFSDIPIEFNVSILKGSSNPRAVYSSKAVGEPPLFLAASIFFAIKDAIKSARKDSGLDGWFDLHSPATAAKIRMACEDNFTKMFAEPETGTFKPWNVTP